MASLPTNRTTTSSTKRRTTSTPGRSNAPPPPHATNNAQPMTSLAQPPQVHMNSHVPSHAQPHVQSNAQTQPPSSRPSPRPQQQVAQPVVNAHMPQAQPPPAPAPAPPPHPPPYHHPAFSYPSQPFPFRYKPHAAASTVTAAAVAAAAGVPPPGQPTFVPHLSYMEGQFATHALLLEQQSRIKNLEAELAAAHMEVIRLRASVQQPQCDPSTQCQPGDAPVAPGSAPLATNGRRATTDDVKKASSRYWTPEEHARFLEGLELFGQKDIKAISHHVGTRSATQVRTHAQKYYLRIERERAKAEGATPRTPTSRDRRSSHKGRPRSRGCATDGGSLSADSLAGSRVANGAQGSCSSGDRTDGGTNGQLNDSGHGTTPTHSSGNVGSVPNTNEIDTSDVKVEWHDEERDGQSGNNAEKQPNTGENYRLSYDTDAGCDRSDFLGLQEKSVAKSDSGLGGGLATRFEEGCASTSVVGAAQEGCKVGRDTMAPVKTEEGVTSNGLFDNKYGIVAEDVERLKKENIKDFDGNEGNEVGVTGGGGRKVANDDANGDGNEDEERVDARVKKRSNGCESVSNCNAKKRVKVELGAAQVVEEEKGDKLMVSTTMSGSGGMVGCQLPPRCGEKAVGLFESGGSMYNLRSLVQLPGLENGGSASKRPTLRRNGSSNSVLADLSKNVSGVLSRSNSFLLPYGSGKGVTRSNSILSLLSGIPTTMRESPSNDRLLSLESGEESKVIMMTSLKHGSGSGGNVGVGNGGVGGGSYAAGSGGAIAVTTTLGISLGDRSLSFGQLNHMGVDDLEDAGAVALSLPDDKWND